MVQYTKQQRPQMLETLESAFSLITPQTRSNMKNYRTNIVPDKDTTVPVSHLPALREIQAEMRTKVEKLCTSRIFTIMGYLNAAVGLSTMSADAMLKTEAGYVIQPEQMQEILNCSRSGYLSIAPCITWLSEYLRQHWPRASNSRPSIYKVRRLLAEEFEVFSFEQKGLIPWRKGERKPMGTPLEHLDLSKGLLLYEVCEQVLLGRDLTLEDDFPEHRGAVMVRLFNWVFKGIAKFGRVDEVVFGALAATWDAIEWFEELFFTGSRIAGEVFGAIAGVIAEEEQSYYDDADIPF